MAEQQFELAKGCNVRVIKEQNSGGTEIFVAKEPASDGKGYINFSTTLAADADIESGQYDVVLIPMPSTAPATPAENQEDKSKEQAAVEALHR